MNFPKRIRLERFQHCGGRCEGERAGERCGVRLMPGKFEYDHANPVAFGGDASFDNCRVLCIACHDKKTHKHDIPLIAKSNRIRAREAGIKPDRKFKGWRLFNGTPKYVERKR